MGKLFPKINFGAFMLKTLLITGLWMVRAGMSQDLSQDVRGKVDAAITDAYQSATAEFPCALKGGGKAGMLHWEQVDRCLSRANDRVDWDALSNLLQGLQKQASGTSVHEFSETVESSLTAHAVSYEKVFAVKSPEVLLPLTNAVLKYLAPDALLKVPVIDKSGQQVGTFSGVYNYDRTGGLTSANNYRLALFQYTDAQGKMQVAADRLLLDDYGVPWQQAASKGSFRLASDKIFPKR